MLVGGWNESSELSEDVYNLAVSLKGEAEANLGTQFEQYHPIKVRQQVVSGMNYLVKIQVSETHCIHVKIYQPLPHTGQPPHVTAIEGGKTIDDQL
jgi:cystatin-A/B